MSSDQEITIKSDFIDLLKDKYLSYALSTITDRALPDVRDGLKPVHRRLLFAMSELKLGSENSFKKCARVVGDVIGKYHPHGEQAVYDSLVKLAQSFSHRYPLIQGQGNFGNIDGDNAAAMRYTESRLTQVSELIMDQVHDGTTEFVRNYDESEFEPKVFPSAFPNLLANGSSGIAVGMATNIPPHNIIELLDMAIKLQKNREIAEDELMSDFLGPDFPTGGVLISSKSEIIEIYKKGRGSLRLRCEWTEERSRNGYLIKITQIPYGVQKSKLIEKLADLVISKTINEISDIRDESDESVCIIIKPKNSSIEPKKIMNKLFRLSDLEITITINMNVLQDGDNKVPKVLGLKEVLAQWLDHRQSILIKSYQHYLEKAEKRIHTLEGYLVVFLDIDKVISIIRTSDYPKKDLISEFSLSDQQAESILEMRLRSLRKLEEITIQKELKSLLRDRKDYREILGSKSSQVSKIIEQLTSLIKLFSDDSYLSDLSSRITIVEDHVIELDTQLEDVIPLTFFMTEKGWLRLRDGHGIEDKNKDLKDGDKVSFLEECYSNTDLLLFSNKGRVFTLNIFKLHKTRDFEPIKKYFNLDPDEKIIQLLRDENNETDLMFISNKCKGMISAQNKMKSQTKNGKVVMNLANTNQQLKIVKPINHKYICVLNNAASVILIDQTNINRVSKGSGISFQKTKEAELLDALSVDINDKLAIRSVANNRIIAKLEDLHSYLGERGRVGKKLKLNIKGGVYLSRI